MEGKSTRLQFAAVVALICLGVVLRVWRLDASELSTDEAFTWRLASRDSLQLLQHVAGDTHPPLHFLVLKAWMAMFGDSILSLRGLSVICGTLCIPVGFGLVREALRLGPRQLSIQDTGAWPAIFAATLIAVHSGQIMYSQIARMYALGALLAAVTALILLKALRSSGRMARAWWSGYGACVALFLLTHHLAIFSVVAQSIAILLFLLPTITARPRTAIVQIRLVAWSFSIALVLYSPWLLVLAAQAGRVRTDFWLPEVDVNDTIGAFVALCAGGWSGGKTMFYAWLGVLAYVLVSCIRLGRFGACVALQSIVPFLCIILVSTIGDQPLLQDRYLVLSQVVLLCALGVGLSAMRWTWAKVLVGAFSTGTILSVTIMYLCHGAGGEPPIDSLMREIAKRYARTDLIVVPDPGRVNVVRYYSDKHANPNADIRWLGSVPMTGQPVHTSSLDAVEIVSPAEALPETVHRVWLIDGATLGAAEDGWTQVEFRRFRGSVGRSEDRSVRVLERKPSL